MHLYICLLVWCQEFDPLADSRVPKISDREDEYRARRRQLIISPERHDPFSGKSHWLSATISVL